jgi:dTDP-4-dehydrorhamnose 3,5-epimerase
MTETFITETELAGVLKIQRPVFQDDRGFFRETFRLADLEDKFGQAIIFKQANHSRSTKDTLRGIHAAPWHKLVTCTRGQVQQVVSDINPDSPTFGKYVSIILGEDNWNSIFVPAGYGNSFLVLSDIADYNYLASDYWSPGKEKEVVWNDPTLNIAWKSDAPQLSEKDLANPTLK